ncbi:arylsulfatase [Membranihabitans maritimus]|uniref:arylsulfatase n=1 Tax=Membranihabitans maritimus TaxID=2904244 RepID=UPI001F1B73D4|nr:arylsulfatase [Membranihabitans maritimus]
MFYEKWVIRETKWWWNILGFLWHFVFCAIGFLQAQQQPNVIIVITDDQGFGDLGINGNPHIKTPNLDRFANSSIRLNNFYVSPVCAPTRSSLMTGRYSLRTGIRDTYNGGATMASNEVTIAEMLKEGGYKTGIFGKWHLGDNYPSRPKDQGFDESVIHLSGGMGQVGDVTTFFQGDSSYFNPVLWHNGKREAYQGYCSDIFADEAIHFIEENSDKPFFCYLSFNAPHTPLQVPEKYYNRYKNIDPASGFEGDKRPFIEMSEKNKEDARKVYAMVSNIDDNFGKLLAKLDQLEISDNTVVIFMTDNGPQQVRYLAGMRGKKGSVYRGGVRVPFYLKYPKIHTGKFDVETTTAHIDVLPTIASLCGMELPRGRVIDGKTMVPLFSGNQVDWENRALFFYWTRKYPELYNNMAVQKGRYKLVGHTDYDAGIERFELFDVERDPYELTNLVDKMSEKAEALKRTMDQLYFELIQSKNLEEPPLPIVGTGAENPMILNRNDASGARGIWNQKEIFGKWAVFIKEGNYNIKYRFTEPIKSGGVMYLEAGTQVMRKTADISSEILEMKNVYLPEMKGDLIPFYTVDRRRIMPFYIELERME